MPPRRGIVKTGNAGNSSKASPLPEPVDPNKPKPLFPPGSKTPLNLLQERCQKNGWDKPEVDSIHQADGSFSFVVRLSKMDRKTSEKQTVRMQPHPPYTRPTALEARHWGAVYALYRFCNGIQLNRVLPSGPRVYWDELAQEHKATPEHTKWMYDEDPFAARKEVEVRQAKAAKKREDPQNVKPSFNEYANCPEVKMATALRDQVEEAVKKAISLYPEASSDISSVMAPEDVPQVTLNLGHLGFNAAQSKNAVTFLSTPSPLASTLLSSCTPLEAAIEFLVLHLPECDLPERFLPAVNSSSSFVTSTHSGTEDLKKRWIEDRAIKEAGWPAHIVRQCTSDTRLVDNWELLLAALGQRLIGHEWDHFFEESIVTGEEMEYPIDPEEVEALGAHYADPTQLVMPLFSAPVKLHILVSPNNAYPATGYPPMYITSPSVPAYIRLHLLAQLLRALKDGSFMEPGEGVCMAAMRILEGEWALIEDNGPPDMSAVLRHLVPQTVEEVEVDAGPGVVGGRKGKRRGGPGRGDPRNNEQVKAEFEAMRSSEKYASTFAARQKLPAFRAREDFLEKLEKHRVVVVVGETGCGKTTQLPQFILDSLILNNQGSGASILVTQPRRLSAISVAARVSSERLEDGSVGYAIRGENKQSSKTKLLFCTTGVVLRRLGGGDTLNGITHVIVDEVHERSVDGDFLLLELKELLLKHPTLKVVLMSATINHDTFVKYFNGAPLLEIPGFTYPVEDIYLEAIVPAIKYRPPMTRSSGGKRETEEEQRNSRDEFKSKGLDDQSIFAIQNISRSDRIDYQLVAATVAHIVATAKKKGGVLIFLPGVMEIRQCMDAMKDVFKGNSDADIFPLHANLSSDEQRRVFASTNRWKIIAATNVAETSITIDDVIYVIDCGKVKETQFDADTGMTRLVETWVTRAAARQRRGRAGRTQPGVCYKLYTSKREGQMGKFPIPEILRVPLESISLTVKVMREHEDVKLFLSRAIDPPKVTAMERAWTTLEELGAVDLDGRLTALGRHMSALPVDLRLAKMLVLGTVFQCLGPILTIAAILSSKPLFLNPMDKRDEANKARARLARGGSDLLTDLNAYEEVARMRSEGKSFGAVKMWCEENFVSASTVRDVTTLRGDFMSSLAELGFIPQGSKPDAPGLNTNSSNSNLLKGVVLGGLWPRVARVHLPKSAIKFDQVAGGTVQRDNSAKEFKIFDLVAGRVFLHPSSVLFGVAAWKSPFVVYFSKHETSKVFLRDATEVPMYALLLFGGVVNVNHVAGGVTVGSGDTWIKLKAWPRIGILVNQLRRLLDAQLQRCIEEGSVLTTGQNDPVIKAMLSLLSGDGLTEYQH